MGGKLEAYIDIASFYSYLAFAYLEQHKGELEAHGVEIVYHPILLGGVNVGSGNRPPWMLPAKGKYLEYDSARSAARVGKSTMAMPPGFLKRANTLLPLRALTFIRRTHSSGAYVTAFHWLFHCFWSNDRHLDLTSAPVLAAALAEVASDFPSEGGKSKLFDEKQVAEIMAATGQAEIKEEVKARTQEALDRGAFGAPWIWCTNAEGKQEPFFGSDRFHFVYQFLGVPYEDVKILPPASGEGMGKGQSKL